MESLYAIISNRNITHILQFKLNHFKPASASRFSRFLLLKFQCSNKSYNMLSLTFHFIKPISLYSSIYFNRALKPCPINETTQQRVFVHGEPCILLVSVINPGNLSNRHPTALPHLVTILGGK